MENTRYLVVADGGWWGRVCFVETDSKKSAVKKVYKLYHSEALTDKVYDILINGKDSFNYGTYKVYRIDEMTSDNLGILYEILDVAD